MNLLPESQVKERRFKIDFKLTPAQTQIEQGAKRFTMVRAGRKFGKTKYSEWKALRWLGPPNSVHWHIAPTYKQAKLISWDAFKRMIPAAALARKPNDSDLTMTLKNNAQLYLMGSDEPDSLRGPAPTSMTLEEAAYHKEVAWHDVLRPNLTVHRAPALFISSPNGFNWFKDLEDAARDDPEWATFHYTIYDNPYIDLGEIESIKSKCDPRVWSQEYMANYESSVGRVFHEFQDTARHVRVFPLPDLTEDCFRSIDWGMRDDTACLWGVVRAKKLYIYREHAENSLPAKAQAKLILTRTPPAERVERNIIGHDAMKQDAQMTGLTVKWHFVDAGIYPLRMGSRAKDQNRSMLQQLVTEDRIVVHPECVKLRKQMLSYSWKDTAMEKTEDGGDDLVDSLHSMVELLQYDLFTKSDRSDHKTDAEIQAIADAERKQQQKGVYKFPLHSERKDDDLVMEGSAAGYVNG